MPSTLHFDGAGGLDTPKYGSSLLTPKMYKTSKGSKVNLSSQPLKIGYQRVNIDVNLMDNKIEGITELTVLPTSSLLKTVKLDCRSMTIKDVYINNSRITNYIYNDMLYINDEKFLGPKTSINPHALSLFDLYSEDFDIHQHHLIRQKLNYIFGEANYDPRESLEFHNGNTEELTIILPDNLKLELTDYSTPGSVHGTGTPLHTKSKSTNSDTYTPIHIKIEYEAWNCKNGVNFITPHDQDKKYWHAYTTNSVLNVSTSSWVPCIDNLWDRCTWSVEVNIPRTIKDIGNPRIIGSKEARQKKSKSQRKTRSQTYNDENDDDDEDEDDEDSENYDLIVCSGDFNNVKETPHPIDLSKKVVSWSIFNPVCAHHVGWALGCFESLTLTSSNDNEAEEPEVNSDIEESIKESGYEDLEKDSTKSPVTIYCFPDQLELARNTCIFANNAVDFFSKEFGSYPFSSYAIVFVSNNSSDCNSFAGLSVVNDTLLYSADIIEPMFSSTEALLESMASQWSGINIVPQTFSDIWCTVGIARFMSFQYIKRLMGTNEYRAKIKKTIDQIVEEDIGKKPLALQYFRFPISEQDLSFIKLKSPIVLFILDRRMTKTDKSFGLSRVLPKLFLQAMSGDLQNSTLSTSHFQYVCEKVNRNKLENFFKQWIYGSGVPIFNIVQKFNKKRGVIEMIIRQTQQQETKKQRPQPKNFIDDSIAYLEDEPSFAVQPVFLGPMTIRVHEADGTPYEHIVDLKEGQTKLDIQYNSKFKRLKKVKEEMGEVVNTFSKLGEVLTSEEDVEEWGLAEWVRHEEDILNEPFEWIRVDVDFEWIAKINVKQADYMYGAQLQYDRDVEAQYEAVKYFGEIEKPANVHCTALIRTVLDSKYYYGVRIAAAKALANFSKASNNFIGVGYLIKAYKQMFCFAGSSIPLSNDFNNFGDYFLQKEIPMILCQVRNEQGEVSSAIKNLILNLIKFNENSNNSFQDCYYISYLLEALTTSVINSNDGLSSADNTGLKDKTAEEKEFLASVIDELNRLQKLDEWVPSYHSTITRTCIEQKIRLATHGLLQITFEDLLYLTMDKYSYDTRVEAFRGLFVLGGLKNAAILEYFLKTCLLETSVPYFRTKLIASLIDSVCVAAIEGTPSTLDDPEFKTMEKLSDSSAKIGNSNSTNMVIIEDGSNSEMDTKRDVFARATLNGAIELLRRDYAIGKGLQNVFWQLIHTSQLSIVERRDVFSACQVLYKEIDRFQVRVSIPSLPVNELKKKFVAKNLGDGKVVFKREGRFKIQLSNRKMAHPSTSSKRVVEKPRVEPVASTSAAQPEKLRISLGSKQQKAKASSKRIKTEAEPVVLSAPKLVSIDENNKGRVTFKFTKHKLAELSEIPVKTQSATQVETHSATQVAPTSSNVTFKFSGSNIEKVKKILSKEKESTGNSTGVSDGSNVRYVKINTRKKTVSLSATPFPENPVKIEPEENNIESSRSNESPLKNGKITKPKTKNIKGPKLNRSKSSSSSPTKETGSSETRSKSPNPETLPKQLFKTKSPSAEPEIKSEKSQTPFSKSGSPFSASPSTSVKKKKTKIYIHSGDSKGSTSSEDDSKKKNSGTEQTSQTGEPKKESGLKLKLNLNPK